MYSLIIIDDEYEHLHGLADFFPFEKEGFEVRGLFEDGKEALEMIRQFGSDVVFTDIRMPEMTGLDIARELQRLPEPPIVCIISAYEDFEYVRQAMRYGVQDYLSKPISFSDISNTLRRIKAKLDAKTKPASAENASLVDRAIAIMERNPGSASLQKIADELGINISYLSRLFKEKTGMNFQEHLLEVKMAKAKELLSGHENYTNNDIARVLGYQDTQNFCRIFRKLVGISPQAYRRKALSSNEE